MQRGQASLEYVAVIAVVAVVFAIAAAVAGADAIPRALAAQVHRAYCLVAGGDCFGESPRPCTTHARAAGSEHRIMAWLGRLGDGRTVLTERRSDGTVAVTVTDMGEALGGPRLPPLISGSLGARLSAGRRWVVADAAAAKRLVEGLDRLPAGEVVRATGRFLLGDGDDHERFARFGSRGEAAASLGALGIKAQALAGIAAGLRVERATGRRTVELVSDGAIAAGLSSSIAELNGAGRREIAIEATFDRAGRATAIVVKGWAGVHGAARGRGNGPSGGDRLETDVRLDLDDPRSRALAEAFLDRPTPAAAARLGHHLAANARIDVRVYATTHEETSKGPHLGGIGVETITTTDTSRLLDAYGREPALGWSRRLDCVGPA